MIYNASPVLPFRIGLAIATRLATDGAKVMVSSRREGRVRKVVEGLKEKGLNVEGMVCHVGKEDHRKNLIEEVRISLVCTTTVLCLYSVLSVLHHVCTVLCLYSVIPVQCLICTVSCLYCVMSVLCHSCTVSYLYCVIPVQCHLYSVMSVQCLISTVTYLYYIACIADGEDIWRN